MSLNSRCVYLLLIVNLPWGRGCMDQVFAVRQVCEKYLANGKDEFWALMDLEKAYDTIDQHGMWQMLSCMELEENC